MGRTYTVVGVDPNSRKIAAVASTPDGQWETFTAEVTVAEAKLRATTVSFLFNIFLDWLREIPGPLFVFVEQPLMGRNVNTMRVMSQVEGIVLLAAQEQGAEGIYEVNVQRWKKDVVGMGNAAKSDVKSYLEEHYDELVDICAGDQDLIDSGAICLYGISTCERGAAIVDGVSVTS